MDKLLFTPGPLTTSATVKEAMLSDLGSRDIAFIQMVREIRDELLAIAGVSRQTYTAVVMQGAGTFGVESVLSTAIPSTGKLLVLANGAYGQRMAQIARVLRLETIVAEVPENRRVSPESVSDALARDPAITHVACVHCETTTGLLNPVEEIGPIVRGAGRTFIVDAMSSFGGVPLDVAGAGIDYLVSSANKCIEGVPGFSFVIARRDALEKTEGTASSVSLDLHSQWRELERSGQFRFTPPTHVLLAFRQALRELAEEGGVTGRAVRYRSNHEVLVGGMQRLGFETYLPPEDQGYIITSFRYPAHPQFNFEELYRRLSEKGFVIYPGKVSRADCFRVGTIGRLQPSDVTDLLKAFATTLSEMNVTLA